MRIASSSQSWARNALGAAALVLLVAPSAMAASFAIDPDPSSPTLGEMLDRESRPPGQKSEPRRSQPLPERKIAPREPMPRQQLVKMPTAAEPLAVARTVTPLPHVPRDAATVILPRQPPRAGVSREVRRIDLAATSPGRAASSPEITGSLAPQPEIRTQTLTLGDIPFTELVRVMRAAEFDAVRYPLKHVEGGTAVLITATPERVARLAQLIALLKSSRSDTAVIAARPEAGAKAR